MQVSALNSVLQGCVQVVGVNPVDVGPVTLDQELDNVVMSIDGRDLHPSPPVLGHIVSVLVLTQLSVLS